MMTIHGVDGFRALCQKDFQAIDYQVMRQAFDLHNELGNLWDEHEYRDALALRCGRDGLSVLKEVCISVSHDDFQKNYFVDLLINGIVYELKTVSALTDRHSAQVLNYLFLSDTQHGKIINFRPDALKWHFVSTSLMTNDRKIYLINTAAWNPSTNSGNSILRILNNLLDDWGAYLSINLYKEALCHFLDIPLEDEHQRFITLSSESVLHFSGLSTRRNNLEINLRKYLSHSTFNELLWINFNGNQIECSCLHNSA